jgi:transcriptional regulator with XRE-family HTH domain
VPEVRSGIEFFFWTDGAGELMKKHGQRTAAMRALGSRIRQLCRARNLSHAEVARRAGLCRNHLFEIMSGRIKQPYGYTLAKISGVLGVGPLTFDRVRIEPELARVRRETQR